MQDSDKQDQVPSRSPPIKTLRTVNPLPTALFALLIALAGCSTVADSDVILADSVYVDVLVDLHLLQARFDEGAPVDSLLRLTVLQNHGVDDQLLNLTTRYYSDNPDEYLILYNKVIDQITEEQQALD